MSKTPLPSVPMDPLKAWRDWFVQNERQWSESLTPDTENQSRSRAPSVRRSMLRCTASRC
jgi:hypothetical protein